MKNTIVAIFSHPDDEAFGPGGTLALLAKENDVHIICATRGDAGHNNSHDHREISELRTEELKNAATILGVKEVHFLDYKDGCLCNSNYHAIAQDICTIIDKINPNTLITYEPRGISGHLDHIAISMITSYVFERKSTAKELWYYCLSEETVTEVHKREKPYFVYMPPGYKKQEIDKTIDISAVLDLKLQAMDAHNSQRKEESTFRKIIKEFPYENFIIKTKKHS